MTLIILIEEVFKTIVLVFNLIYLTLYLNS